MTAYYNEHDPYAAQWLRNLISAGHIAPGEVDERSIEDVRPDDLAGFTQCHFFAGIGIWSHALRRAGWRDDSPVWTGSCPCQPFSAAGKGNGFADERHLWPAWFHLITQRRPPVVFGEQVASSDGLAWLDLVQTDLEAAGYATAPVDICAAGVGAPHIRQRLWFVADANGERLGTAGRSGAEHKDAEQCRNTRGLADSSSTGLEERIGDGRVQRETLGAYERKIAECHGDIGGLVAQSTPSPINGHWRDADWLYCRDGKWRPVEPGAFPLAHGAPARVGRLRAYGNAIVPQVAEQVIRAYLEK